MRDLSRPRDNRPARGTYPGEMPLSIEVRRDRLSRFVARAMQDKKIKEGWTVDQVLKATGIGRSALYRWLRGDWKEDPQAAMIEKFCDGMGIPAEDGLSQLWPGKFGRAEATQPLPIPKDVEALLRRLADETVAPAEKQVMLQLVRQATSFRLEEQARPRVRRAS